MKKAAIALGALLTLFFSTKANAIGVLVPTSAEVPPLAIESHRVEVNIKDQTAQTRVVQVFKNSTSRDLEAIYTFPIPKGATVSDFALWMDGKKISGEILEKDKAKEIYQKIVARVKDPGLLEYVGMQLFQAKIFPVPANGTQKVELSFTSVLPREGGVSQYTYPLKTDGKSAATLKDFTLTVNLESKIPIKNVYSPSHAIYTKKKDDTHATVGFEFDKAVLERDFQLYYSLSKADVGVDLLTYKRKNEDGYFMLMVSPKEAYSESEIIGKHVTFVMDTSGSMSGQKMESARKALIYCLEHLRDDDTFSLIRFSSDVESFQKEPKPATKEWIEKSVAFAQKMEPAGGTAIYDALQEALKVKPTSKGPNLIVFLTDGSPTIGEIDPKRIADATAKANAGLARLFVFGVGETIHTVLLDQLAADNGGFAEYMKPDSEIETVLTSFYNKISYPVLANVNLTIPKVMTRDLFPRALGDLYKGEQILLFGRYKETGSTKIALGGTIEGKTKKFEYEGSFPEESLANDFIPLLWANRKVGYLLEEIRINGEQKELKEEVVRLAKEFGIVTPYTSYLVVDEDPNANNTTTPAVPYWNDELGEYELKPQEITREDLKRVPGTTGDTMSITQSTPGVATSAVPFMKKRGVLRNLARKPTLGFSSKGPAKGASSAAPQEGSFVPNYNASTGAEGVEAAKDNRSRKETKKNEENGYSVYVGGKLFLWNGTSWVDAEYNSSMKTMVIAPMSEAYFQLLKLKPELSELLALGSEVTIVLNKEKAIVIIAAGRASIPEPEMYEFVK